MLHELPKVAPKERMLGELDDALHMDTQHLWDRYFRIF